MRIEEVDKNIFKGSGVDLEKTEFYSSIEAPFTWLGCYQYGVGGQLAHRNPPAIAEELSPDFGWLNKTHSGVRVAFSTDSPFLSFLVEASGFGRTVDDTLSGGVGIFVTAAEEGKTQKYISRISPTFKDLFNEMSGEKAEFSGTVKFSCKRKRQVIVWLPTLTDYKKLYIGIEKGSYLGEFSGYRYKTPVVFYCSSITHGGDSSRPGNAYTAIISRRLCAEYINLGFSGSAKGEQAIAEHIASLKMSAFVFDYDHNAPTPEHLAATHQPFFKTVREKNPELPIIMVSRPGLSYDTSLELALRRQIVFKTYLNAKLAGDQNVYFVDGNCFKRYRGYSNFGSSSSLRCRFFTYGGGYRRNA